MTNIDPNLFIFVLNCLLLADDIIGRRQSRYEIKNDKHMQISFNNVFILWYFDCKHWQAVYELQVNGIIGQRHIRNDNIVIKDFLQEQSPSEVPLLFAHNRYQGNTKASPRSLISFSISLSPFISFVIS